jgi:uncharacterized Zn-finger protein
VETHCLGVATLYRNDRPWEKCPNCGKRWVSQHDLSMWEECEQMAEEGICACGALIGDGTIYVHAQARRMAEEDPRCDICRVYLDIDRHGDFTCPNSLFWE